ncbi:NAD-dependent epimerase/dehydratase family protein [Pseudomonas atacamensis]|uniref:SDR family oxidoreductase n=1 Tax=Pseudomonas iranensis TaxID=2745503 RepID=A0AAU7EQU7_9PSED
MNLRCKYSAGYRIAVTGSTGYVGSKLLESFETPDFVETDFAKLPAGSLIVHLAANMNNASSALSENTLIDTFVLEQVNEKHRGLIYASTNNVYPYALNCSTNDTLRCNDYYSASKVFGEKLFEDLIRVPFVSVRIADVFGIGQKHGNFFKAIEQGIRQKTCISQYGAGLKRRTYIHIADLAELLKWIATDGFDLASTTRVLNTGYADSASIAEIVALAAGLTGLEVINKSIEHDLSAFDVRTMRPTILPSYTPQWSSFKSAFTAYVEEINLQV